MFNAIDDGNDSWAKSIRNIIFSHGFSFIWNNQHVPQERSFLAELKERLIHASNTRHIEILQKLHSGYLDFNGSLLVAPYTLVCNYDERRPFALLRLCSLPLKNNLHRWGRSEDNFCDHCMVEIEHEVPFLLHCPKYKESRERYLFKNYPFLIDQTGRPREERLIALLNEGKHGHINDIIKFIHKAFGNHM